MESIADDETVSGVVAALANANVHTDAASGDAVRAVKLEDRHGDDDDDDDTDDNDDDSFLDEDDAPAPAAQTVVVQPATYDIDLGRTAAFLVRCGVNLVLPFVNGMMMGFGEIFAHELCFRWQWQFARVQPAHRMAVRRSVAGSSVLG